MKCSVNETRCATISLRDDKEPDNPSGAEPRDQSDQTRGWRETSIDSVFDPHTGSDRRSRTNQTAKRLASPRFEGFPKNRNSLTDQGYRADPNTGRKEHPAGLDDSNSPTSESNLSAPQPAPQLEPVSNGRRTGWYAFGALVLATAVIGWISWSPSTADRAGASPHPQTNKTASVDHSSAFVNATVYAASKQLKRNFDVSNIASTLANQKRYRPAYELAVTDLAQNGQSPQNKRIFNRSIRSMTDVRSGLQIVGEDVEVDAIETLPGGKSTVFKFVRDGEPIYSFKPDQGRYVGHGWVGEVAAYRLCQIIVCHFRVPQNRPVKITKQTFKRLYSGSDDAISEFDDLNWQTENRGENERRVLYGTLERWVDDFVNWPIEYTELWQPWLEPTGDVAPDKNLEQALRPLKTDFGAAADYRRILSERSDASIESIATQVSSLLVFDFLTSNWDRFSRRPDFYGVNNQFADGYFISIDNGAAFSPRPSPRLNRIFKAVKMFERRTIASIRALEPEVVNPILFPPELPISGPERDRRLSLFWAQRDNLLQRVAKLAEQHGDNIYDLD